MSESHEQIQVVTWFRIQYPQHNIIAIPNAQKLMSKARNPYAMQKTLAKEGLTAGVSDLFIPVPATYIYRDIQRSYHGMWLEMKDEGKGVESLSPAQYEWAEKMTKARYYAVWAAGFGQAREIITEYMKGAL